MKADYGSHYNLAERIDKIFPEVDGDICVYLRNNDNMYSDMWNESLQLKEDFPVLIKLTESSKIEAFAISPEEHAALQRYLSLKTDLENYERKKIYYRGHMDSMAYLVEVAGLHVG